MKIIQRRRIEETVSYLRSFSWAGQDDPYYGFGFDCNGHGNVDEDKLNPCALDSYRQCLTGMVNGKAIVDRGIQTIKESYTHPAIGECECGEEVYLSGFTNSCVSCDADYNLSGRRLADREQWGEETSETVSDILMGDIDPFGGDW